LFGFYGRVTYDPEGIDQSSNEKLMAMSVYKDTCARSEQMYFSKEMNEKIAAAEWEEPVVVTAAHWMEGPVGILIIIYMIFITLVLIYIVLKHRKQLCGKN